MPVNYENIGRIWDYLKDEEDTDPMDEFTNYIETTGDPNFDYMSLTGSKL